MIQMIVLKADAFLFCGRGRLLFDAIIVLFCINMKLNNIFVLTNRKKLLRVCENIESKNARRLY